MARVCIWKLALADLVHDFALNLCVFLALVALITPILITFGFKHGTIQVLRRRLMEDPSKCEVVVRAAFHQPSGWIEALRQRSDVGFVIPKTRPIANEVVVRAVRGDGVVRVALEPTGKGDPVLRQFGIPEPENGSGVLTALAADVLGVQVGDTVEVFVETYRGGVQQQQSVSMQVSGIVPTRGRRLCYVPLAFLEAVEAYKDGREVVQYGWKGAKQRPKPIYDGVVVLARQSLPEELQSRLLANTGLGKLRVLTASSLREVAGWTVEEGVSIYLLYNERSAVEEASVVALRERLRGTDAEVFYWVDCRKLPRAHLDEGGDRVQQVGLAGLSVSPEQMMRWGIVPAPRWGQAPFDLCQLLVSNQLLDKRGRIDLGIEAKGSTLVVPCSVVSSNQVPIGVAMVPVELAGILRHLGANQVRYDARSQEWFMERGGYSWMRLYARTIDDVASLQDYLSSQGIVVSTEAESIAEVNTLNRHLARIFFLLASVGVVGGISVLVANFVASVERKKRELGILRLLGFSLGAVIRFPIWQAFFLVTASYVTAAGVAAGLAVVINGLFSDSLRQGEHFCLLPLPYLELGYGIAAVFGVAAALIAVIRIYARPPAAAIRDMSV